MPPSSSPKTTNNSPTNSKIAPTHPGPLIVDSVMEATPPHPYSSAGSPQSNQSGHVTMFIAEPTSSEVKKLFHPNEQSAEHTGVEFGPAVVQHLQQQQQQEEENSFTMPAHNAVVCTAMNPVDTFQYFLSPQVNVNSNTGQMMQCSPTYCQPCAVNACLASIPAPTVHSFAVPNVISLPHYYQPIPQGQIPSQLVQKVPVFSYAPHSSVFAAAGYGQPAWQTMHSPSLSTAVTGYDMAPSALPTGYVPQPQQLFCSAVPVQRLQPYQTTTMMTSPTFTGLPAYSAGQSLMTSPATMQTAEQHSNRPLRTSNNPIVLSQNMPQVWEEAVEVHCSRFTHRWRIKPVNEDDVNMLKATCFVFDDSAKVRFLCKNCLNAWTSMKGRVRFYISEPKIVQPDKQAEGIIHFQLFGQMCDKCSEPKHRECVHHSMWYPEEVSKVVKNVSNHVGKVVYKMEVPRVIRVRRTGRPRTEHRSDLCQACKQGICREANSASKSASMSSSSHQTNSSPSESSSDNNLGSSTSPDAAALPEVSKLSIESN